MQNVTRFKIFEKFPELTCGIVGRPFKYEKNLIQIVNHFKIKSIRVMYQVHGIHIHECDFSDKSEFITKTDGLITKKHDLFLAVKIADCVPLFFYEPTIKMVAIVHAGWKGTLKKIAEKMVTNIVRHGGRAENILVAIGPYIHECCYNVLPDRFLNFKHSFTDFSFKKPNFLDLGKICAYSMIKLGIPEKNIEVSRICTQCNVDKFYSFRGGDRNVNNIGVIGIT